MVLHRLPESVRLEWSRVGEGKVSDLEGLLQFLFIEIQRRERSRTFQTQVRDREERKPGATAATLHSASDKKNDGPSCGVCSGKHRTERYFGLKDLEPVARKNKCLEKGLCFIFF
ncbi:hypothetical protein ElyMa_007030100 [Elysia marginata]|uniref:Uncharacterized protein n=1 Tax=Elysia marginata TaxID=1093978 RepID=A0AAV4JS09_9GAST|nr:hypothetical protein ElyMa_007030100 [Elysia marginata]